MEFKCNLFPECSLIITFPCSKTKRDKFLANLFSWGSSSNYRKDSKQRKLQWAIGIGYSFSLRADIQREPQMTLCFRTLVISYQYLPFPFQARLRIFPRIPHNRCALFRGNLPSPPPSEDSLKDFCFGGLPNLSLRNDLCVSVLLTTNASVPTQPQTSPASERGHHDPFGPLCMFTF